MWHEQAEGAGFSNRFGDPVGPEEQTPMTTKINKGPETKRVSELSLGGAGGVGGLAETDPAMLHEIFRLLRGAAEGGTASELLKSVEKHGPKVGSMELMLQVLESVLFRERRMHSYTIEIAEDGLRERADAAEINLPLGFGDWPKGWEKLKEDPVKRKEFVREHRLVAKTVAAFKNLAERFQEYMLYGDDIKELLIGRWTRPGKQRLFSGDIGAFFEMEETFEGLERFGVKLEKAMKSWLEIGRGEAEATFTKEGDGVKLYRKR